MNSSPIDPISIPHFTGNVDALVGDIAGLAKDASDIRATGTDTHASFQGLSAHYEAPEAGQLLHSTLPVRERAAHFADELNKVKSALSEYAAEVRPIVQELDRLREQAVAFRASIGNDDKWLKNQSKTDENRRLIQAVTTAQERFHAAERNAFNKITGLFDKSLRLVEDDGTHKKGMYGYDPKAAAKAEKTPWGNVEKRKYEGAEWFWHEAVDGTTAFAKGFLIDGTWAQIRGLGTLVGVDGADKAHEALKNMALLAFASNYVPGAEVARYLPDSWLPKVGRDYKKAANGASKGLLAWDEWGKNPYRAFGTLTFNGLTLLTPVGEATAATKAGMTAKAITTAAKVVEVIDPATYAVKGARLGLKAAKPAILKVGDLAAELKQSLGKLPDHTPTPAGESLKYTAADGKALLLGPEGHLRAPSVGESQPGTHEHHVPATPGAADHAAPQGSHANRIPHDADSTYTAHNDSHSHETGTHLSGDSHGSDGPPVHRDDPTGHSASTPHEEGHRGTGDPLPAPQEVKQALIERNPQVIDKSRYAPDDGHYHATRVFEGGRPDGQTVLAGHGYLRRGAGEMTVPPGTTISFYVPHGDLLPGLNGLTVEAGIYPGGYVETFRPGETIPDYTLDAPAAGMGGGFSVFEKSTTVSERTPLSQILKPSMGDVHWAACRDIEY
ncbi:putative adhesin [Streptomyces abikoensis]|uniref:putative adhesin n=1 Tax=Streptomyces abikoensis TaxID=97398 RepID=UPI0034084D16